MGLIKSSIAAAPLSSVHSFRQPLTYPSILILSTTQRLLLAMSHPCKKWRRKKKNQSMRLRHYPHYLLTTPSYASTFPSTSRYGLCLCSLSSLYSLCLCLYQCRTPSVSVLLGRTTLLRVLYNRETMKQLHLRSEQSQIFNSLSSTAVPPHSCPSKAFHP